MSLFERAIAQQGGGRLHVGKHRPPRIATPTGEVCPNTGLRQLTDLFLWRGLAYTAVVWTRAIRDFGLRGRLCDFGQRKAHDQGK